MTTFITHHHTKSKFTDDYTLFNKWFAEGYKVINQTVLNNLSLNQLELCSKLSRSLHVYTGHILAAPITYWVSCRGDRHITVTMTFYDVGKIKYRIAVPSLVNAAEKKKRARYDLGVLVGDISQDFYECSYNAFDVYRAWRNKSLNNDWTRLLETKYKNRVLEVIQKRTLFDVYLEGKEYDWEELLSTLYGLANGWPTDWLSNYKTHEELANIPCYSIGQ